MPFGATWELRFGSQNRFRIFYEIDSEALAVWVLAVGVKEKGFQRRMSGRPSPSVAKRPKGMAVLHSMRAKLRSLRHESSKSDYMTQAFEKGDHKIYWGDAREVLSQEIRDHSIDLIFADPPYNIGKNFNSRKDRWNSAIASTLTS